MLVLRSGGTLSIQQVWYSLKLQDTVSAPACNVCGLLEKQQQQTADFVYLTYGFE